MTQSTHLLLSSAAFLALLCLSTPLNASDEASSSITWHTDYHTGLEAAANERKLALVWFFDPAQTEANDRFEDEILSDPKIATLIAERCESIKLPTTTVSSAGEQVALLDHPAFSEMLRSPGLALIDMVEPDGPLHRQVVSVFPFTRGPISAEHLAILLDLPRGSLTQRTLIFAVRTHPESPASTTGHLSHVLARETESHSTHQANITLQGHHNWSSRFHAINAELPGGLAAREVCAESWPGQNLLEAAVDCVHSWRQSPGHWDAVSSPHILFAYDMKRGKNGIWYATGLFAE
jgi:hypothetical protein